MKLIIDIDDSYLRIINKNGAHNYEEEVIKNGTPIPKGHGKGGDNMVYDALTWYYNGRFTRTEIIELMRTGQFEDSEIEAAMEAYQVYLWEGEQ